MQARFVRLLAAAAGVSCALMGQARPPAFEVAAIRPAESGQDFVQQLQAGKPLAIGMQVDGARVTINFLALSEIVRTAFRVKQYQIKGPDWMTGQRFDIQAALPSGASKDQIPEMLQTMLAERFKMTVHREPRDLPVYALIVGKNGTKLTPAPPDPDKPLPDSPGAMTVGAENGPMKIVQDGRGGSSIQGGPYAGTLKQSVSANGVHLEFTKATLANLADLLTMLLDRPVLDMTELKGNYTLSLDLPLEDLGVLIQKQAAALGMQLPIPGAGNAGSASTPGSSVFAAMEKLGLKLEARKAPVDTVVIDHIERNPTEN